MLHKSLYISIFVQQTNQTNESLIAFNLSDLQLYGLLGENEMHFTHNKCQEKCLSVLIYCVITQLYNKLNYKWY